MKRPFLSREFMNTPVDWIRFVILFYRVRRMKIASLWEANIDKFYYETTQAEYLKYDDTKDRETLFEERQKPLKEQDKRKISDIEERIGRAKAVQAGYRKNEQFRQDVKDYIKLLNELPLIERD